MSNEKFDENKFSIFCKKYNLVFPKEYVEFIKSYNDGELEPNIVDCINHSIEDMCSIRYFFGTTTEDYSNIEDTFADYVDRMPQDCFPIAESEGSNIVCMSSQSDTYGRIYFWDHEEMDIDYCEKCTYTIREMPLIANDFEDLLNRINQDENEIDINDLHKKFSFRSLFKK